MQFVYPTFLFALFTVLIPVIIHLFYFRRYKSIVFSDVRFLKKVEEVSKSNRRLRDYLILLSRILVFTFLVLAFAKPFIPGDQRNQLHGERNVAIYIDNSFSMQNEGSEGPLLEEAKSKARAIVNGFGKDVHFTLATNAPHRNRWLSKGEIIQQIDAIKAIPSQKTLKEIQSQFQDAVANASQSNNSAYIISDFQTNAFESSKFTVDSTIQWNLLPVKSASVTNLYLDTAWLLTPNVKLNQPLVIRVKVKNSGTKTKDGEAIVLKVNGVQKAIRNLSIAPDEMQTIDFTYKPTGDAWQQCEVSLTDYPIVFDDKLFLAFKASTTNNVLAINGNGENKYINAIFKEDADYSLQNVSVNNIEFNTLSKYDLILLNEIADMSSGFIIELKKYIMQGGQVCLIPPSQSNSFNAINNFLMECKSPVYGALQQMPTKVDELNLSNIFFRDVFINKPTNPDYPVVQKFYTLLTNSNTNGKMLLQMNNGNPFLWYTNVGLGKLNILSVPLNTGFSNFQEHALFVPVMLKLGLGVRKNSVCYYPMQSSLVIGLTPAEVANKLIKFTHEKSEVTGEVKVKNGLPFCIVSGQFEQPGIYQYTKDAEKVTAGFMAFNYPRKESEMHFDTEEMLQKLLPGTSLISKNASGIQAEIASMVEGVSLWRLMLILAAVFILTEVLLLKFWKV